MPGSLAIIVIFRAMFENGFKKRCCSKDCAFINECSIA